MSTYGHYGLFIVTQKYILNVIVPIDRSIFVCLEKFKKKIDLHFTMQQGLFSPKSQSKGMHGNFQYENNLSDAIEGIRAIAISKHRLPQEYSNCVEHLYNIWIPKGMKDEAFMDEVRWYETALNNKLSVKRINNRQMESMEYFFEYELPVRHADMLFKAILKSMERAGLLPREKVAITI